MSGSAHGDNAAWLIPPEALTEWLTLARAVDALGDTVPCRTGDPDAWWPDKKALDSPDTQGAIASCWSCGARGACLAYAEAAGEREGVWGGLLPAERLRLSERRLAAS